MCFDKLGDVRRQHLHLVARAARLQLPVAAGAAHLDDAVAAVDGRPTAAAAPAPSGR